MPEIGGEDRQQGLDVQTAAVPITKRGNGKAVPLMRNSA